MSASGLSTAVQLSRTAASHAGSSDTLLHMVVCDGIPATSMISQPGVFLGNLGFIVQSLASMQGPFLNQRAGSPLVYGERHLGWVRLQGVASGSTGPCPAPVDSRLWRHAPLPVSWGQTASQVHWGSFHEQRAQFRGGGVGKKPQNSLCVS